jgi:LacI family transcriptional regulator, gluconate utilization system Gnt-I transcriptional repressor
MADVAARVGVSKMTVSRVLAKASAPNGASADDAAARSPVSPLHRRILQACDEMGYVLDRGAGSFSTRRSGFVAAVIPTLDNSNFAETTHGLAAVLEAAGLQLLMGATEYLIDAEERLVEAMLSRRPEGVLLTGGVHTPRTRALLQAAGVPVVETWDVPRRPIEHAVGFSNAQASAALVRHLHAQGRRRIAFLGGTSARDARGLDRRRGYATAVRQLGLPEGRVFAAGEPPISMAAGAEGIAQVLQAWPEVDAVLCVSDICAFGALAECQRRGWAVPQRLAIAGFGDFEVARNCHPRLTTIAVDCAGIGRAAGELLLGAIEAARSGKRGAPQVQRVPFRVEVREST